MLFRSWLYVAKQQTFISCDRLCPVVFQNGESAIELAYGYRYDDIVTLLMSHGDKVRLYVLFPCATSCIVI